MFGAIRVKCFRVLLPHQFGVGVVPLDPLVVIGVVPHEPVARSVGVHEPFIVHSLQRLRTEVMIGFTTANRIPSGAEEELLQIQAIPEHVINRAFLAAAEAEQEAILNSMTAAERTRGQAGELYYSLSEYLEDQDSKQ